MGKMIIRFVLLFAPVFLYAGVVKSTPAWVYDGEFQYLSDPRFEPGGVAIPRDYVFYATDRNLPGVWLVWRTGHINWGGLGSGPGQFDSPNRVALSPEGEVYVTDGRNRRIQYFTPNGSYVGEWPTGPDTPASGPKGLAISPGHVVYVTITQENVVKYFTLAGSLLGSWGGFGTGEGYFNWPWDVSLSPSGRVYVLDQKNRRVQYFTPAGSYLGQWPVPMGSPQGMAVAPDGAVFVTILDTHSVYYFTSNGSLLGSIGWRGSGAGEFDTPRGVGFSNDGELLYVADEGNARVQWFRKSPTNVRPTSLGRIRALYY